MRRVQFRVVMLLVVLGIFAAVSASATVSVPSVVGSHMVLQQGKAIRVWGKADAGECVKVTLGHHVAKTVADAQGRWKVRLPKMHAGGGPYEMKIAGTNNIITLTDILIGEVWVASGQSNMQFCVRDSINGPQEIASANYPSIRLFYVPRTVSGEPAYNCDAEWKECSPATVPEFSAVAYFFGRELHNRLNVPVGLVHTSWGGTPAESWTSRHTLESDPDYRPILDRSDAAVAGYPKAKEDYDKALVEWTAAAEKAKAAGQPEPEKPRAPVAPENNAWRASVLYNAMICPIAPFAIQGAIWYQGESNAGRAFQYRKLFPAMIKDWRRVWHQGPFSFYFVQLANFTDRLPDPAPSDWAELREAQTMTLGLENTGMAVITDIGDAKDIHPRNKQDVGKRLALNALAKDYHKRVAYAGPTYKSMCVRDGKAILHFTQVRGGLVAKDGALKGFAIAGEDKKFVWADAKIKGGSVVVSSPQVGKPVAVRYAWANNPECTLYDGTGLPASPFRTDSWPGVTVDKR